jgi:hypothetical protein
MLSRIAQSRATHGVGIALLVIGLLAMAVPISPILRARVRRREAQAGRKSRIFVRPVQFELSQLQSWFAKNRRRGGVKAPRRPTIRKPGGGDTAP